MSLAYLYSGSNRGKCDGCREFFAEHPEFLQPDEAEKYCVRGLEIDDGRDEGIIKTAALVAAQIGRADKILITLRSLVEKAHERGDDKMILLLSKTVRSLESGR